MEKIERGEYGGLSIGIKWKWQLSKTIRWSFWSSVSRDHMSKVKIHFPNTYIFQVSQSIPK